MKPCPAAGQVTLGKRRRSHEGLYCREPLIEDRHLHGIVGYRGCDTVGLAKRLAKEPVWAPWLRHPEYRDAALRAVRVAGVGWQRHVHVIVGGACSYRVHSSSAVLVRP